MSLAQFILGARLRAADVHAPAAIAAFAPVLPPLDAIAVAVDTDGEHTYLAVTDSQETRAGTDRDGLDAVAALGATMSANRRTLIVGTDDDLATLTRLARQHPSHPASAVIAWWDERADFPGTDAVVIATAAARERWVLGVHPQHERNTSIWAQWLNITATGPHLILELARRVASGPTLPGLLVTGVLDTASWDRHSKRIAAGRPWWSSDTRIDAALGLIARSHAAERYASIRLDDPLVALAASHDGTIVPGTITTRSDTSVTIEADRPLSRLRLDARVTGWVGEPIEAGRPDSLTGTVTETRIDAAAQLTITLDGIPKRAKNLAPGVRVTLRPGRVDPNLQTRARSSAAAGYRRGTNWIGGRGKPVARRGEVPLDVVVAAAED